MRFCLRLLRHVAVAASAIYASAAMASAEVAQVKTSDLQAVARSLAFVEAFQHRDRIQLGIVYAQNDANAKAAAEEVVNQIQTISGTNSTRLQGIAISTDELSQSSEHCDALFLMAGTAKYSATILNAIRRDDLVSVSDDPACLDSGSCVLMVQTSPQVEIVLNTELASAIGARFSVVFTMMVKRK